MNQRRRGRSGCFCTEQSRSNYLQSTRSNRPDLDLLPAPLDGFDPTEDKGEMERRTYARMNICLGETNEQLTQLVRVLLTQFGGVLGSPKGSRTFNRVSSAGIQRASPVTPDRFSFGTESALEIGNAVE